MHSMVLLAGLVAILYTVARYRATPAPRRAAFRDRALLIGGGVLLVLMVLRGGLNPLLAVVLGVVGVGLRVLKAVQHAQTLRGAYKQWTGGAPSGGGNRASTVRTRFIEMTLDHESGKMDGSVLAGRFAGRRLDELGVAELRALHRETATDPQSRAVLDAYVERVHGERWSQGAPPPTEGAMSLDEARRILGVDSRATREDVVSAHRRLMQKLHPDRGGSNYLAAQVNEAKRVLLEA